MAIVMNGTEPGLCLTLSLSIFYANCQAPIRLLMGLNFNLKIQTVKFSSVFIN